MTYEDVKRIRENPRFEDCDNRELHRLINEAIEKQIPKKPDYERRSYNRNHSFADIYSCPICGEEFELEECNYCSYCGQAIKWEEE